MKSAVQKTDEVAMQKNDRDNLVLPRTDDPSYGDGWRPVSPGFPVLTERRK